MRIKQVILIRKDLSMRRGKEIAQGSHASLEFLMHGLRQEILSAPQMDSFSIRLSLAEKAWIAEGMAKICLKVASEEELLSYHQRALQAGLKSFLIRDSGRTEFHGQPTLTACAIGPDASDRIDAITGDLILY